MTALVFAAGWVVGAASLAFALGAVISWADREESCECDDEPLTDLYVPREWVL